MNKIKDKRLTELYFERQFDCTLEDVGEIESKTGTYIQYICKDLIKALPFHCYIEFNPTGKRVWINVYPLYRHNQPGEELERTAGGKYVNGEWKISWN